MKNRLTAPKTHLHAGFTLLEVLVAVALVVVVSTLAFMGLDALVQARVHTDQASYQWQNSARAWQLMRQDIRFAIPRPGRDTRGVHHPAFVGQPRQFQLLRLSPANADAMNVNVHKIRWQWRDKTLWRGVKVPPEARSPQWREYAMLTDNGSSRFEYQDSRGRWHAQWPPPGALSSAGSTEYWPATALPQSVRWLWRDNGQERVITFFPLAEENADFP